MLKCLEYSLIKVSGLVTNGLDYALYVIVYKAWVTKIKKSKFLEGYVHFNKESVLYNMAHKIPLYIL